MKNNIIQLIVIGTSQGGFQALTKVLLPLPYDFPIPILVVRHQGAKASNYVVETLNKECHLDINLAHDGEKPRQGNVYFAPPNQHLLVSANGNMQLSSGKKVNFSRPAIDPLFQSAAKALSSSLLAIVLTGANNDGAEGVKAVKKQGGRVIVQDPESAEADTMPKAAMAAVEADYVVWGDQIGPFLWQQQMDGWP